MDGVAYTTGSHTQVSCIIMACTQLERTIANRTSLAQKEIHFSLDHIKNSESRAKAEIEGVLTHEVVHCYQYNAKGTAPGGFIEGIAGEKAATPL